MSTITISKAKYQELKNKAEAYERIARFIEGDLFSPPPSKSATKIMEKFKKTGRYNLQFLKSLEKGLARSSRFKK